MKQVGLYPAEKVVSKNDTSPYDINHELSSITEQVTPYGVSLFATAETQALKSIQVGAPEKVKFIPTTKPADGPAAIRGEVVFLA